MKALVILAVIFIATAVAIVVGSKLFEIWEDLKK